MPPWPRVESTDDWHPIDRLAWTPGQRTDDPIRLVVLFGQSSAERDAATGAGTGAEGSLLGGGVASNR
jgi:hypothetical protein